MEELVQQLNAAFQRHASAGTAQTTSASQQPVVVASPLSDAAAYLVSQPRDATAGGGSGLLTAAAATTDAAAATPVTASGATERRLLTSQVSPSNASAGRQRDFLSIEGIDQVRSERASPRGSNMVTPLLAPAQDRDETQTLPFLLDNQRKRSGLSASEWDVYQAAERLCIHICRVDYRRIAREATAACDTLLRMVKEEMSLIPAVANEMVPVAAVVQHVERLRLLFEESRSLLAANNIPVPQALDRLVTAAAAERSLPPSALRHRAVSVDVGAGGGGGGGAGRGFKLRDGLSSSSGTPRPFAPAPEEEYDIRAMHGAFDDRTDAHTRELEDEVVVLKGRLERANKEKKELAAMVERQESQLGALRAKLSKETEAFYATQRQMQADLRQLALNTGNRDILLEDGDGLPSPTAEQGRKPHPPAVPPSHDRSAPPRSSSAGGAVTNNNSAPGEQLPSPVAGVTSSRPGSSKAHTSLEDHHMDATHNVYASSTAAKYNRVDTLYHEVYSGKGMEFLWSAIETVFKLEYDCHPAGLVAASPPSHQASPPAATPDAGDGSNEGDGGAVEPDRTAQLRAAHQKLLRDLQERILGRLANFEAFCDSGAPTTSLRSEYIANCVQSRCKPNSGIVTLLSRMGQDREVEELNLSGNYVGDAGLAPLLPLLRRLYRLQVLRLADNGIKNSGVHHLCLALRHHASLTVLDLSKNNITRSAGRDLLGCIALIPRLAELDLTGTHIDSAMQEKIQQRLKFNREGSGGATPSTEM